MMKSKLSPVKVAELQDRMRPLQNALRVDITIRFDFEELQTFHPQQRMAIFRGIAEILAANPRAMTSADRADWNGEAQRPR